MRTRLAALSLVTLSAAAGAHAAPPAAERYVLLLDCSGSVSAESRKRAVALCSAYLSERPGAECAVIEFADRVELALDFGDGSRLRAFEPDAALNRQRTALYDAVFEASRRLFEGGPVPGGILLFTDGVDTGSDLLLEDSVRICLEGKIPICAFGVGPRVDEKLLRRLGRLTGGFYEPLGAKLAPLLSELQRRFPVPPPTPPPPQAGRSDVPSPTESPVSPAPPRSVASPAGPRSSIPRAFWTWLPIVCIVALAMVGALFLVRRGRSTSHSCPICGGALEGYLAECPNCRPAAELRQSPLRADPARPLPPPPPPPPLLQPQTEGSEEPAPLPDAEFPASPSAEDASESTVVLLETPVLVIKKGKNLGAVYPIPWCGAINVGRSRSNNVVVEDRTASSQHCRLKHDGEKFFLYDLKSTNGTFLNERRVSQAYLRDGDTIQVGETHLLFKVQRLSS